MTSTKSRFTHIYVLYFVLKTIVSLSYYAVLFRGITLYSSHSFPNLESCTNNPIKYCMRYCALLERVNLFFHGYLKRSRKRLAVNLNRECWQWPTVKSIHRETSADVGMEMLTIGRFQSTFRRSSITPGCGL